ERRIAWPTLYKGDELFHMLGLRRDVAVLGLANVVQLQPQMIFRGDRGRTRQVGVVRQQRNDVAGSGRRDGLVEPRQRTHVNHYTFLSRTPRGPRKVNPVTDSKTHGDRFVIRLIPKGRSRAPIIEMVERSAATTR